LGLSVLPAVNIDGIRKKPILDVCREEKEYSNND